MKVSGMDIFELMCAIESAKMPWKTRRLVDELLLRTKRRVGDVCGIPYPG